MRTLQGMAGEKWLPDMDLNHDKQIQSLLCYRYTIGQTGVSKVTVRPLASRLLWRRGKGALADRIAEGVVQMANLRYSRVQFCVPSCCDAL